MSIRKVTIITVILAFLMIMPVSAYTGPSNVTAAVVNDTRVDPNATIAFQVGPILNGTTNNFVQNGFALNFDGVGDYVNIANEVIPDFSEQYTVSIFYRVTGGAGTRRSLIESDPNFSFGIEVNAANVLLGSALTVDAQVCTALSAFTPVIGTWYHATLVYVNGQSLKLYNDGVLVSSGTVIGNVTEQTTGAHIGTYRVPNDRFFVGDLDECTVYNRSLGVGEINYITDNKVPLNQSDLDLWIDFDTNVLDQSPSGNDGTLNGDPQYVRGLRGKADIVLDGTGDYVSAADSPSLNPSEVSASIWVKSNDLTGWHYYISKTWDYYIASNGNTVYFGVFNSTNNNIFASQANGITVGTWVHILGVYNTSDPLTGCMLYINGVLQDSTITNDIRDTANNFYLGTSNGGGDFANATVSEARVYNRTLMPDEILEQYNGIYLNETGLILHMDLDGNVLDTSGNGNNGAENGDPEYGDGWANVPVYTSINGRCSLANSTTGMMTLIQDAPATVANYTVNVYPVTNSVLNATIPLFQVDLYNIDVGALYTEVEATFNTLIYANGSSVLDGHELTDGDTLIINGVTLAWNSYMSRFEATTTSAIPAIVTYDTLTSLIEATYSITNGNISTPVTVVWTTPKLDQIMPFMRTGDWPGAILSMNYLLMGETITWTFLLTVISVAIYQFSGAETALLTWMFGWSMFGTVIHSQALTISLILMAIGGGVYIAKFFLDRRTSV